MRTGSLFAGIGGIDLAFRQAGHEIIFANEIDEDACKTYKHNFREAHVMQEDIRNIDETTLPDFDILIAGFPCQPFSIMGKQMGFKDPRGNIFFEIIRIIKGKKPKIIFLENVKNLIAHNDGKTFTVIKDLLIQLGYAVKFKIMNAYEYGNIPQDRNRLFIVAFSEYNNYEKFHFPKTINLITSINDIIDRSKRQSNFYYYKENNKYYKELNNRIIDKNSIYRIDDTGVAKRRYEICPTLKANMGTYHDRVPIIRDDFGLRKLTPKECLALQGFPIEYDFPKILEESAYKQAGNTVCVPVVKRIAERIGEAE